MKLRGNPSPELRSAAKNEKKAIARDKKEYKKQVNYSKTQRGNAVKYNRGK